MNILLLSTHLNTGGITSYLLTLSRGLIKNGCRVWIASSGGNMQDAFQGAGVETITLNIRTKSELDFRIYASLIPLRRLIQRHNIDLIHANTRITQVMAACLHRFLGQPYVATCHGFFKPKFFRKVFPCWGQRTIAISDQVKDHLIKDFAVPSGQVVLIKNGIDIESFPLLTAQDKKINRRAFGLDDEPVVGIIARLSSVKGQDVLVEAMKKIVERFPKAKLLIVGEGNFQKKLELLVENFHLQESVRFYPIVNRSRDMLSLFTVFVMPSRQEGLGLSVIEAQSSGLPVVASKVGGLPTLIDDGRTGLLVPPENPKLLAEAILLLLDNPKKALEMGKRARVFVVKEFSSQRMVSETMDLYRNVLSLKK